MTPTLLDLALKAGFSDPIEGWMGEAYEERLDAFAKFIIEHDAAKPAAWVGLTDEQRKSVCRVGPVYAPDGVVTRRPLEYRKELEGVALMAVRQAEALLREKNGGAA